MNSSFTISLDPRPTTLPLSPGMRRFVFESLVTSAALLAIGGLIVWWGGELGSVSDTLHAGRICLVLSIGLSVTTALIAAAASRRWPGWKMPSVGVRFLVASALFLGAGYFAYGSQTGRALLALAAGSALAAVTFYEYSRENPDNESLAPARRLADILNQTVSGVLGDDDQTYVDEHHLSIVFDEPGALPEESALSALPISEAVDRLLTHHEYEAALKLCIVDFDAHLLDIGTIFLVHAANHQAPNSYHALIDSVEDLSDLEQRILLHWIALLCRGWVTNNGVYLNVANELALPLSPEKRDPLFEAIQFYGYENAVREVMKLVEALDQRIAYNPLTESMVQEQAELNRRLEDEVNRPLLTVVFDGLQKAQDLSDLRVFVHHLFWENALFKPHLTNPDSLPSNT